MQVSVFVVNLKGRPFMGGLSENKPLLYSLAATFALTFMSASETIPRVSCRSSLSQASIKPQIILNITHALCSIGRVFPYRADQAQTCYCYYPPVWHMT